MLTVAMMTKMGRQVNEEMNREMTHQSGEINLEVDSKDKVIDIKISHDKASHYTAKSLFTEYSTKHRQ